eukprot:CAMPEP_0119033904 /NCGR_PEP_ID=MMETSP1177-20130426/969_1 /TAXON_ID=2985 /ORGANISM="Ochromonas sp, Strain CCMP1899" /LENGTH=278 /DNA_ID=CAMNT_0006991011 /DNA_START=181 /DNA_END=1018 /DNA_ORIENTATION=-
MNSLASIKKDYHRANSLESVEGGTSPTSVLGFNMQSCHIPSDVIHDSILDDKAGVLVAFESSMKLEEDLVSAVSDDDPLTFTDVLRIKRKKGEVYKDFQRDSFSSGEGGHDMYMGGITDVNIKDEHGNIVGHLVQEEGDEYLSSRRRRRLNLIVPNPRKPRTADYMCSLCSEAYQVIVGDNPWWAVYLQECPECKQQQVPRIDINSASNAIELDPNVMALYGEGVEDSGEEECEGSDEEGDEDISPLPCVEGDQEDLKRDVYPFDGEGLLAAEKQRNY